MATRVRCLPIRASWPAPPATMPRSSLTLRWRLGWLHCTALDLQEISTSVFVLHVL